MMKAERYTIAGSCDCWYYQSHPTTCRGKFITVNDGRGNVVWTIDDNDGEGYTKAEALRKLWRRADRRGDLLYFNENSTDATNHPDFVTDDNGKQSLPTWYKGAGLYTPDPDHVAVITTGATSFDEEGGGITVSLNPLTLF